MFRSQSVERDSILVYPEVEAKWRKDNNLTHNKKGYIDNKFLTYIVTQYMEAPTKENGRVMGELLDLMIRKNMTAKKYIVLSDQLKADIYSNAMCSVLIAINKFNKNNGTVFTFLTTIITNAFKNILTNESKHTLAISNLYKKGETPLLHNIDKKQEGTINMANKESYTQLDESITKLKDIANYNKESPTIGDDPTPAEVAFYKELIQIITVERDELIDYCEYDTVRLLTSDNLPSFKRKYKIFNKALNFNGVPLPSNNKFLTDEYKKNIIVVEFIDIAKVSEHDGMYAGLYQDRVIRVRNNGMQYFGVYSDDWSDPTAKELLINKLIKMRQQMRGIQNLNQNKKKFNVALDYIPPKFFREYYKDKYKVVDYFGLDKTRKMRHFLFPGIDNLLDWLNADKHNTRIWSLGTLDLRGLTLDVCSY